MDDFYMTLPSNVKSTLYENTIANYRTKLAYRKEFPDNWEVGLAAISYTYSWMNITRPEYIKFKYFANGKIHYLPFHVKLEPGLYTTIEKLLFVLNSEIKSLEEKVNTPEK